MGINYEELFNNSYSRITQGDKGDRFFTHFYALFIGSTEDLSSPGSIAQRLEKQKIIYKTFFYMLSVANTHIVADYGAGDARRQPAKPQSAAVDLCAVAQGRAANRAGSRSRMR